MKKKNILIAAALLTLAACGGKKGQPESAEPVGVTATANSATDEKAKQEIVGVINKLYAAAAQNEGDIDRRFACHAWRQMVEAVEEKDSKLEEIGFFNHDYWTEMQDSNPSDLEARNLQFEQLDAAKGTARVAFSLHSSIQDVQLKFTFCREDGDWRVHDIIRIINDADGKLSPSSFMEAMKDYLNEPTEQETPELTFANMAGIYDSFNDDGSNESRFGLHEDGTATWNMVGSLHLTEYTYTINGNTICLKAKGVDTEEECYEYDANTRTLKNEQGAVYHRQTAE